MAVRFSRLEIANNRRCPLRQIVKIVGSEPRPFPATTSTEALADKDWHMPLSSSIVVRLSQSEQNCSHFAGKLPNLGSNSRIYLNL
ncbi:MAG: hypothetical protein ACLQG3_04355 [Terracidiphilus sp.]